MNLLLLEDIKSHASLFEYAIEDLGWKEKIDIIWAQNFEEGEEKLDTPVDIDIMFVDYKLGIGKTGADFCKVARRKRPDSILIVLSSSDNPETITETYQAGANAFIPKFEDFDDALDKLNLIFRYYARFNKSALS